MQCMGALSRAGSLSTGAAAFGKKMCRFRTIEPATAAQLCETSTRTYGRPQLNSKNTKHFSHPQTNAKRLARQVTGQALRPDRPIGFVEPMNASDSLMPAGYTPST